MVSLILLFLTIFILESVLSVDNAAVLAICVNRLPPEQRGKALRYGIWGAYLFRGLSLFFVTWLLNNPDFGNFGKLLGGFYLCRLAYKHFTPQKDSTEEGDFGWLEKALKATGIVLPLFWLVVIEVEVLDFVFSLDNIFAVSAMTQNLYVIIAAVFLAILTMRFVTQKMSTLMEKYPYLENRAYIVIFLIGLKLGLTGIVSLIGLHWLDFMHGEFADMIFSIITMSLFLPIFIQKKEFVNANTQS